MLSCVLGGRRWKYWFKMYFGLLHSSRFKCTKPQRLTVAGVRFFRESASNTKHVYSLIFTISPLAR